MSYNSYKLVSMLDVRMSSACPDKHNNLFVTRMCGLCVNIEMAPRLEGTRINANMARVKARTAYNSRQVGNTPKGFVVGPISQRPCTRADMPDQRLSYTYIMYCDRTLHHRVQKATQ